MKNGKPFVVELPIVKVLEQFVTPFKQTAKEAGIEVDIKYVDGNTLSENMMERNFSFVVGNYGGLVFPNPESSLKSDLADRTHTNNVTGFKSPYIDKLIDEYRLTMDQARRVEIIRKVDSVVTGEHLIAFWWAPKGIRIATWNKFGMPKGIVGKNTQVGDQDLAIMTGWWLDPAKDKALEEARKSGSALEGANGIIVNRFWKTYKR
jgi:ABC-type oligopeptide transport system substrate-binding subunit